MPDKPVRFVVLTDVHMGADPEDQQPPAYVPSRALSLLCYVIGKTKTDIRPDFVVQLGDLIVPEGDAETDLDNLETVIEAFKRSELPVYHVVGTAEQRVLDSDKLCQLLNYPRLWYSVDKGSYHFIFLFGKLAKDSNSIEIEQAERNWLVADLQATDKPVIVFTHHPLHVDEFDGENWCDTHANDCLVENADAIRQILTASNKVKAVFCGHRHRNQLSLNDDGLPFVLLQSLVANLSDSRKVPSESFAIVTAGPSEIRVEIEGMDPAEFRF